MRRVLLPLCLMLGTLWAHPPAAPKVCGLWVVRHNLLRASRIDSVLRFAAQNQFTDLFVQVRGRGDAYYNSHLEPRAERLAEDFDPLAYLLEKNQQYHFRIHAWVNVFYVWSNDEKPESREHVLNRNPEWLVYPVQLDSSHSDTTLTGRRNAEGWFQSPIQPEVQQHVSAVIEDILNHYPVDGIHLDYIRYPDHRFDFNPLARQRFKQTYMLDPLDFKRDPLKFIEQFGWSGYEIFFTRWAEFLRRELSDFVEQLTTSIHHRHPGVIVSAAVKADLAAAHWQYYQEWDRWLREGWLDWAVPMNYTPNQQYFHSRIEKIIGSGDINRIVMGIALYNQPPDSALSQIRFIQNNKFPGYVLFSYDQFLKDVKLRRKYFREIEKTEKKP